MHVYDVAAVEAPAVVMKSPRCFIYFLRFDTAIFLVGGPYVSRQLHLRCDGSVALVVLTHYSVLEVSPSVEAPDAEPAVFLLSLIRCDHWSLVLQLNAIGDHRV